MKKILAIALVVLLALSVCIPAVSAAQTGSITITNATIGQTYDVYLVFDAHVDFEDDNVTVKSVSYSIRSDNQFFKELFGADGKKDNLFFIYNTNTGDVTKKDSVNDSELVTYLTNIVNGGSYKAAATAKEVTSKSVRFENLPFGYYVITSSLGSLVTINSNTPNVEVIDKNQEPVPDFNKQVQIGVDENDDPIWGDANSAGIGEEITYSISFTATNYDGDKKIKYYQIHDEKGDAIWAEFNSFKVVVGTEELTRGYYLSQGGINTDNWEFLGDWSDIPVGERDCNDAQWYLVHLGYDQFRITIPWLKNHTLNTTTDASNNNIYSLSFADGDDAEFRFDSPVKVEITYRSVIEAGAAIGGTSHGNRFNKAHASWISSHETGSNTPDEVVTGVYGIGLLKEDSTTRENLAGAKFRIYSDKNCTQPVYIIPTNIQGVYIVDSKGTPSETITGLHKQVARDVYADYLAEYLGNNEQDNYVVTPENGKVIVLGLKAGTYYLVEVEPPAGYIGLTLPVEITAGKDMHSFVIFADEDGNVADIQTSDGVHTEHAYDVTYKVVQNSQGQVLPSTGGKGAMWLITIGSLLAIGFAVFLITHKKMSVYND